MNKRVGDEPCIILGASITPAHRRRLVALAALGGGNISQTVRTLIDDAANRAAVAALGGSQETQNRAHIVTDGGAVPA